MKKTTFGYLLRQFREQRKLTQKQLAELAGFSSTYIYMLETERKRPSWETIQKLANVLKIATDDLR